MKRVVITGMGCVTPLGHTVEASWKGIRQGSCGIATITHFDTSTEKCHLGAEVKNWQYPDLRAGKRLDLVSQYALTACQEAMDQSGLISGENIDPQRLACFVGSGIGGIGTLEEQIRKATQKETTRHVSAFMVPMLITNLVPGNLALAHQAKGNCLAVVTACASGTHAIGEAFREIRHGYADAVITGGGEAPFSKVCFAGFANMTATTTATDPKRASIPFDGERQGFVMGEGAGILILEELEHAQRRGAPILGEIVGYGSTCDAYHITAPDPEGKGAARAMALALDDAHLNPQEIDYINAHGTGTPLNDLSETKAIKQVFGEKTRIPVSSTKGHTGHLLGAAGAVEAIFCVKALEEGFIPPTINYRKPDSLLDLDYVPNIGRRGTLRRALSNSLGFGGHNGTLVFQTYQE